MNNLQQRLMTADRPTLLVMLAEAIHELTIRARYFYDRTDALGGMQETNEAIHHVSGHLRDLIDPIEPTTASRGDSIVTASELLPQRAITRIYEFTA
ncbi:hypothetical protein [Novosphingobium malaysiense]|nr:hypothetical protein [Novosphingobium malaysiense]